jgi:serine/threonine-protein kinase
MGIVYAAQHLGTRRDVVLKVLRPQLVRDARLVDAFLKEADTVARLGHENIIDIYYGGRASDGLVFLAMERLEGRDLATVVREEGPLPWSRARGILLQVTSALGAVHEAGVVHGDIKPANIFLCARDDQRDFIKLLDFGAATFIKSMDVRDGTRLVMLTPEYAAPEHAGGRSPDVRSDVYSLGGVMYNVLTGSPPFGTGTAQEVMARHALEPLEPLGSRRPDLSITAAVETIVAKAMAKLPEDRYASMSEMADAFGKARFTTHVTPPPGAGSFFMEDPIVRQGQRRKVVAAAAIVLGFLLVVWSMVGLGRYLSSQVRAPRAGSSNAVSGDARPVVAPSGVRVKAREMDRRQRDK